MQCQNIRTMQVVSLDLGKNLSVKFFIRKKGNDLLCPQLYSESFAYYTEIKLYQEPGGSEFESHLLKLCISLDKMLVSYKQTKEEVFNQLPKSYKHIMGPMGLQKYKKALIDYK